MQTVTELTAFHGPKLLASGNPKHVAQSVKEFFKDGPVENVLVFDNTRCHIVDIDFRGSTQEVLARLESGVQEPAPTAENSRGPGRPKLGVVAKEITLLPRHWDWLSSQPGGASVALRKLVEEARRINAGKDQVRAARECSYRFMSTALGHEANFEEASRALFAGDYIRFEQLIEPWPADLRDHLKSLAAASFLTSKEGDDK